MPETPGQGTGWAGINLFRRLQDANRMPQAGKVM
jgi:hypothetical protein